MEAAGQGSRCQVAREGSRRPQALRVRTSFVMREQREHGLESPTGAEPVRTILLNLRLVA